MKCSRVRSSGNVLFLILIAVALFTALAYAVTSSTRNSSADISSEKAKTIASALMQTFTARVSGYERLRISGCDETEINMGSSYLNSGLPVTDLPTEKCDLESGQGAGLSIPDFSLLKSAQDFALATSNGQASILYYRSLKTILDGSITDSKVINVGTSDGQELMIQLNFVQLSVCEAYNKLIGISGAPSDAGRTIGDEATELGGQTTGCRYNTSHYQIFYVYHPH